MPESSNLNFSKIHHEDYIIKYISSRLPMNTFLLVKENKQMLGINLSTYKNKEFGKCYIT